jgi:threonine dehydrogenase-like Zn-dependent dehydrogenase
MDSICCQISKAAFPGDVDCVAAAAPSAARDEVLIAPLFVGLCGSDLRLLRNEKAHVPGTFGHEVVARVIAAGRGVEDFAPGDQVTVNPVNPEDHGDIIGYNGTGFLGTHFLVNRELLRQGRLLRLRAGTAPRAAVFAEPLACCVRSQRALGTALAGATVVIVGAGSFGLLHFMLARHAGAADLLVTARGAMRLDEAKARGILSAQQAFSGADGPHPLMGRADVVIVTANGVAAVREASRWAAPGASLLLFGGLNPGDTIDDLDLGRLRRAAGTVTTRIGGIPVRLVGSYGTGNVDFLRAVELIESGVMDPAVLVTHEVSLRDLPRALGELPTGKVDGRPVLKLLARCS